MKKYAIKYEIIGRRDGRWVVRAIDSNGKQIGLSIYVQTPSEAWKIWCVLNGYSDDGPTTEIDRKAS